MIFQIVEYDELTGEILIVRTFDAQQVPWQPTPPGRKQVIMAPEIGERIKTEKHKFEVDRNTGLMMEKVQVVPPDRSAVPQAVDTSIVIPPTEITDGPV